jgi:hypothetical protein
VKATGRAINEMIHRWSADNEARKDREAQEWRQAEHAKRQQREREMDEFQVRRRNRRGEGARISAVEKRIDAILNTVPGLKQP